MNTFRFEAEIVRAERVPTVVVRERVYVGVRVSADWPVDLSTPEIRVGLEVKGDVDGRDAPAYVELFFHDVYLLINLAVPGSFGGTVSITGGGLRSRELVFNPRVFEYAVPLAQLPLAQVANDGVTTALFELLHLARGHEDEESSILRLARATEALVGTPQSLRRLFELREEIASGTAPVFHPMFDDALDPRIEDATREWIDVADAAARVVIGRLQELSLPA